MVVFITGAAGFIGSHTARALLEKGVSVIGFDNFCDFYDIRQKEGNITKLETEFPETFTMIRGDLLNEVLLAEIFAQKKITKIIHLAAMAGVRPSLDNPKLYEAVNVRGTVNLFCAARDAGVRKVVFASSSSVYGAATKTPFAENDFLRPISPYAANKLTNENDAFVFFRSFGMQMIGLRFFTVYGPAGRPDMAPWLFADAIFSGRPIMMFGDGTTRRDYTFVDDIVSGILLALNYETDFEVFNLGRGETIFLKDFIATIENLLGKKAEIIQKPLPVGDVPQTLADISKAQKMLGYAPKTSLNEGMEKFIDWFLSRLK